MEPWTIHRYSLEKFPFPKLVRRALNTGDLSTLIDFGPRWTERQDQNSVWHRNFYAGFDAWRDLYRRFVREVIAPIVKDAFYFQAVPTFRVHLPENVAVGTFHTDATYHHPLGETTFWLPVTAARGTSSVWVADDDDELWPITALPGQVARFSAVSRRHGNMVNLTGRSRVSFDFRCIPAWQLPDVEGPPSENMKLRFVPGEYYDEELVTP